MILRPYFVAGFGAPDRALYIVYAPAPVRNAPPTNLHGKHSGTVCANKTSCFDAPDDDEAFILAEDPKLPKLLPAVFRARGDSHGWAELEP
jgi:hypothetical protein